jgi:glycosyltransferase involved in cell wall biosynthesis
VKKYLFVKIVTIKNGKYMKILIVTVLPFSYSSIERMAEMVRKYNEHLDIKVFPFHGKRYSKEDLKAFEDIAKDYDLIDFEYWRGAEVLLKEFPWLKDKKKILVHHNPYDLFSIDPKLFDLVVVKNKTQQEELQGSYYIPHAVDLNFFEFNDEYTEEKTVGMVAFRIEGKKGIKQVAQACKDLGYKFILVGKVSKPDYMKEVLNIGCNLDFREKVSDEELKKAYRETAIHVCNSTDNFESGTLPILEAMASGVPVLTRNIGLVPDIYNGDNMLVRNGQKEDVEDLKFHLKLLMDDREKRLTMRKKAWESVRNYSDYRLAKRYVEMFNYVMYPDQPLVSIITPTYNREEQIVKIIESLKERTYKNIELVICDDNSEDGTESFVKSMRENVDFPIKYINTDKDGYNLAMARNLGAIEADGEFLMFLDSRLIPEKDAIERFIEKIDIDKKWLFGDKGYQKKSFVENFSFIRRKFFIEAGMCCERITKYGGMSQELRNRFRLQGFQFVYVQEARATEIKKAQKMSDKRSDILEMKDLLWKMGL